MKIYDMLLANAMMGEGGGGGGGGDFSTAEITLNLTEDYGVYLPRIDENNGVSLPSCWISGVYNVILYKGVLVGFPSDEEANVSVTGDIEYDDGEFVITGDGTITIS